MTGEDWNAVMYNGVNAYGGPKTVGGLVISLYFVLLVIFGNCILSFNKPRYGHFCINVLGFAIHNCYLLYPVGQPPLEN